MNAITSAPPAQNALIPATMADAVRLAEMMARGKMLPAHLQGSPGDCLMVVEQAMRWQMSPFAVAQCTTCIKGRLMFEGKLVAAAVEHSGAISGLLDYNFSGSGDNRKVTVSATRRGESAPKTVEVVLKDVATTNDIWKKQPDQQLCYAGVRVWARRWTPGVMLGVYSPEEFGTGEAFAGPTLDGTAEPLPEAGAHPPAATEAAPRKPTVGEWLDALEADLKAAQTADEVDAVVSRQEVQSALDKLRNGARDRLNAMVKTALDRTADDFPGVVTPRE